jgi:hypothetical protein
MEPKFHGYSAHQSEPFVLTLSQSKPVDALNLISWNSTSISSSHLRMGFSSGLLRKVK